MIHRFAVLPSTNDEALRLAAAGAPAGTAVVADAQTAGRGRAGHAWASPPGVALYLSIVLRPRLPLERLPLATLACGIAVAEAVRAETGLPAGLKWPNDVLVRDRKCAGLLCEGAPPAVVAGIGVNVNTPAEALPVRPIFPATSLLLETGAPQDREALLAAILDGVARWIARLEAPDGPDAVVARFNALDALRGRAVAVDLPDGTVARGTAHGCAPSGALLLSPSPAPPFAPGDVPSAPGDDAATPGGPREILAGSVSLVP